MEYSYTVPGTTMFEDVPIIRVSDAHKGYLKITLDDEVSVVGDDIDCIAKVYEMINETGEDYSHYLVSASIHNFDLDKALRKTLKYVWNHSHQGFSKCFNCCYETNWMNSNSILETFEFKDNSYVNENTGECCIGQCMNTDARFVEVKPYRYAPQTVPISFEEFIDIVKPISLKEYDMLDRPQIILECKIKNVQAPKLNDHGYYNQYITIYDEDTRKTIKACFNSNCSDFDKWDNGDSIIAMGSVNNRKKRPFTISRALKIKNNEVNVVINRNQETPGYDAWRGEVIARDKVCQCCGLDKHLQAHHIFGYAEHPELATDVNNGLVLCKFCHEKYHSIYGLKDINPRDLVEFIKDFGVVRK